MHQIFPFNLNRIRLYKFMYHFEEKRGTTKVVIEFPINFCLLLSKHQASIWRSNREHSNNGRCKLGRHLGETKQIFVLRKLFMTQKKLSNLLPVYSKSYFFTILQNFESNEQWEELTSNK